MKEWERTLILRTHRTFVNTEVRFIFYNDKINVFVRFGNIKPSAYIHFKQNIYLFGLVYRTTLVKTNLTPFLIPSLRLFLYVPLCA